MPCAFAWRGLAAMLLGLGGCSSPLNDPHAHVPPGRIVIFEALRQAPKHLDPASAYTWGEKAVLDQVVEPLYTLHYLKRPYVIVPAGAAALPTVSYRDAAGHRLPDDAPDVQVAQTEYRIPLRQGSQYGPHPAFARTPDGRSAYVPLPATLAGAQTLADFPQSATREIVADDYVWQIKRLARPGVHSPAFDSFRLIVGMDVLAARLQADAAAGRIDSRRFIDLGAYPLEGVSAPDPHTLTIRIRGKYAQMPYWFTMGFFSPLPREVDAFFSQPALAAHNLTLDRWPPATGPYQLVDADPNRGYRMVRNPKWHGASYPCEGTPEDQEAGRLADCGKPLPFADELRWVREREPIPVWGKFTQGWYDQFSSVWTNLPTVDVAVQLQAGGSLDVAPALRSRGVSVATAVAPCLNYWAFNLLDPVLGGQGAGGDPVRARKLRQALSIALDAEAFNDIFRNGLDVAPQGPIPDGMPGFRLGAAGINPVTHRWIDGAPHRRSLDEARRLLAEAGYPDGRNAHTGAPLVLRFDAYSEYPAPQVAWAVERLRAVSVQGVPEVTDLNRLREKMRNGSHQIVPWSWCADYPDPENMLLPLTRGQASTLSHGADPANYANPAFDALYERLRALPLDADRGPVIDQMVALARDDAPWAFTSFPTHLFLNQPWLHNAKPGLNFSRAYWRIDATQRDAARASLNRPARWPWAMLGGVLLLRVLWRGLCRRLGVIFP